MLAENKNHRKSSAMNYEKKKNYLFHKKTHSNITHWLSSRFHFIYNMNVCIIYCKCESNTSHLCIKVSWVYANGTCALNTFCDNEKRKKRQRNRVFPFIHSSINHISRLYVRASIHTLYYSSTPVQTFCILFIFEKCQYQW